VSLVLVLALVTVGVVLVFDYTNGFNDAANVVATVIASNAMTPRQAVVVVGVFELLGPLLGGTAVANTIGNIVHLSDLDASRSLVVVLCALSGAIIWNVTTWWRGLPSSSSHALVGALAGAVVSATDVSHVEWGFSALARGELKGVAKVVLALLISPVIGFAATFAWHRFLRRQLFRATPAVNGWLRAGQYVTAASLAFSHGANDAQKSMGILGMVLLLGGFTHEFVIPTWVIFACATAMTLGILSGGWRIVRTLAFAIYRVRPLHALDSQLASAGVIFGASLAGVPVSTTHVVSSSIMGVGAAERPKAVHWDKAREIVTTWIITIPGAAAMAAGIYLLVALVLRLAGAN
jgi:PiT family inorganic phosphate transporter